MQLLADGQDKVDRTYAASSPTGDWMLHKLMSGAFQFGVGPHAQIVTSMEQVNMFGLSVQEDVRAWLETHGPEAAMQEKVAQQVQAQAEAGPGSLDARLALLDERMPGIRGEILSKIDAALVANGLVRSPTVPTAPGPFPDAMTTALSAEELRILQKAGYAIDPQRMPRAFDPDLAARVAAAPDVPDHSAEIGATIGANPITQAGRAAQDGRDLDGAGTRPRKR